MTISSNGTGDLTYNLDTNTFRDAVGHALLIVKSTGPSSVTGTLNNNTIGVAGLANSGSLEGDGLKVQNAGQGTVKATITNNQIHQYNNFGIEVVAGGGASAQPGALNIVVTGNTIGQHGDNGRRSRASRRTASISTSATVPGDTYQACAQIGGAGALANAITGSGVRRRERTSASASGRRRRSSCRATRAPPPTTRAVVTFVAGNNGAGVRDGLAQFTTGRRLHRRRPVPLRTERREPWPNHSSPRSGS